MRYLVAWKVARVCDCECGRWDSTNVWVVGYLEPFRHRSLLLFRRATDRSGARCADMLEIYMIIATTVDYGKLRTVVAFYCELSFAPSGNAHMGFTAKLWIWFPRPGYYRELPSTRLGTIYICSISCSKASSFVSTIFVLTVWRSCHNRSSATDTTASSAACGI